MAKSGSEAAKKYEGREEITRLLRLLWGASPAIPAKPGGMTRVSRGADGTLTPLLKSLGFDVSIIAVDTHYNVHLSWVDGAGKRRRLTISGVASVGDPISDEGRARVLEKVLERL